jgi:hypothetical protein
MMKDDVKKSLQKILIGVMFALAVINCKSVCQEFISSPLITMPGNNLEFDVQSPDAWSVRYGVTFVCWVNKLDSVYTVYLKQLSPIVGDAMIVASDTYIKSKPQITSGTVGWQSMHDSLWQVSIRSYSSNSLNPPVIVLDSLAADPHFTLSNYRIAWIQNNNLFAKSYYPILGSPILVDSALCSSPCILKKDNASSTQILYENVVTGQHRISIAQYNSYPNPQWTYKLLAGDSARNPNYGIEGGVSFEIIRNQISRVQYSMYYSSVLMSTTNQTCNYKNSSVFSYPVTTGSTSTTTPFFIIFDSDSIPGNNEIFMKPFSFATNRDTMINISRSSGNDVGPRMGYIFANDTTFVTVFWKHIVPGKTDIWQARTPFNPIIGGVEKDGTQVSSFRLMQNYPNPFNPATKITFSVGTYNYTSLRVYDVLGREVAVIFSGEFPPGAYARQWNASSLPSGVYFYRLQAGTFTETKKLVLLK